MTTRSAHLALVGPTASGKSALALEVARRLGDVELVSADSMQVYRGMDIGTAKPAMAERGGIPHHLIDVIEPWASANVADYRHRAREAVDAIERRGRRVLFVGGTPLYLKALLRGLFDGPAGDPRLRYCFRRLLRSQRLLLRPQRPGLVRQPHGAGAAGTLQAHRSGHE